LPGARPAAFQLHIAMKLFLWLLVLIPLLQDSKQVNNFPQGRTFYIDALAGDDSSSGASQSEAWKTLNKVNSFDFLPGDKILFRAGRIYEGQLKPKDSGREGLPIQIDKYGEGYKPRIQGNGVELSALHLYNVECITVKNLDISNYGPSLKAKRCGVLVELKDFGKARQIQLLNLDIHDVNGSLVKNEGGGAGIILANSGNKKISTFDGVLIADNTIKRCTRNGILINGYWERSNWHPSRNVIIRNNLLEGIPGDGIVPIGCDGALIERNAMQDCPRLLPDGEAAAGIWPWSCDNTVIQYNEVSGHKAPWDAQGFDSDWNCRNTLIQYNYSHDNEGGFLLLCNDGGAKMPSSLGNTGTVVRYNLSVNDGLRVKGKHAGFSPVFHIAGPVKNSKIYNNIVYLFPKQPVIDSTLIDISDWNGLADSTVFSNNIFYVNTPVNYNLSLGSRTLFENNVYYGNHLNRPQDLFAITADPLFLGTPGLGLTGLKAAEQFRLSDKSPLHNSGRLIQGAELKDFFGNKVIYSQRPSVGIHQYAPSNKRR